MAWQPRTMYKPFRETLLSLLQDLGAETELFAIEFCIQVFADNYASQDFAFRSSTYPAGRV